MRLFLATVAMILSLAFLAGAAHAAHEPRVLLLSSYHPGFPSFFAQVDGLRQALAGRGVELDVEFMDSKRFYDPANFDNFTRMLTYKLDRTPAYDVLVVADDNALVYAVERRDTLFKDVPIVFMAVNNETYAMEQARALGLTGVIEAPSMAETVDLMRRLKPELRQVVVVADATPTGRADLQRFRAVMGARGDEGYTVLDLGDMTWAELPAALLAVDPSDAILLLAAYRDRAGKTLDFAESLEIMTNNARCPIFHLWEHGIGQGTLGGKVISFGEQGRLAGELALKILDGAAPESLPVVSGGSANLFVFDWPTLKRFGIDESLLPEGSVVRNHVPSFFSVHRTILVEAGALVLLLVAIISYLLRLNRDRTEAQRQAMESEQKYRAYIESAPDAVLVCDGRSTLLEANPALSRLTGYEPDELIGKGLITALVAPHARPAVMRDFVEFKKTNVFSGGLRIIRKDGSRGFIYLDMIRLGDDSFIGFCKDLTEARAVHEALEKSEELFRGLLSQAGDSVFVFDQTGRFQFVNEAACDSLGYTREALMGLGLEAVDPKAMEFLSPEGRWQGKTLSFESIHQRRDGKVFPVDIRMGRIHVGSEILFLALCRDVTRWRESERIIMRESRINLAQAEIVRALTEPDSTIENIAAVTYQWTMRVTGASAAYVGSIEPPDGALHLYNRKEMRAAGCEVDKRVVVFHRGADGYPALWGHSLNTGQAFYTNSAATHPMSKGLPEGHLPVSRFLSVPCFYEGVLVGQICAANPGRDFNNNDLQGVKVLAGLFALAVCRKRAEIELVEARDAAEAASRTKSEFLANVSHELRTPLNGMFGMLQLFRGTPLADEQQRWIDTALASGRNLLQVINDVLDLSKVEAGKIELLRAPFSLRGLIESVRSMFDVAAREKNLTMTWTVDDDLPDALLGDQGRIRQILFNLVGNSLKFTDTGTIAVSCEPGGPRDKETAATQEDDSVTLLFTVRDTGIGIPADKIASIFNAFEQVDGSSARRYQGAGLGLGIVKRFVELMGGEVQVDSVMREGTTISFTVRVGLAPSDRMTPVRDTDSPPEAMGPLRLLLAEDDRINQLAARALLEREGFTVDVAESGKAVLAALAENDYDCILMDIQMPGMDGLEATKVIRSDDRFKDKRRIPIIALTAHAMIGDRENFIKAGMDDYLSKPMEIDALRRVVARVVGAAR